MSTVGVLGLNLKRGLNLVVALGCGKRVGLLFADKEKGGRNATEARLVSLAEENGS